MKLDASASPRARRRVGAREGIASAEIEIGANTLLSAGISDVMRWPLVAEEIAIALANGSTLKQSAQMRAAGNILTG
ncbi:hypothetical protein [Bradyrhizobium tropiciagri]|uniref:hypothetical protein n=1 Tax=Bradyrhizobium tropiciagri TaxID=312253 RepID=UPI00067E36C2|nr:hypothetical protein [Bradyrhizobium tropiciagri]